MARLTLVFLLVASPAFAQGFHLSSGWDLPQTPSTQAVAQAITKGLCDQAAIDSVRATGIPADITPAGHWPDNRKQLFWYGKGEGCNGKYQYVSEKDGGGDLGYRQGWEISWDPQSYVDGAVPGLPVGNGAQHPTAWRLQPLAPWDGSVPTAPPVVTPPPVMPTPPPIVTSPVQTPAPILIDYAALLQQIIAQQAQQIALEKDTNAHVAAMDKTIGETLGQFGIFVSKYVAPAIAAWIAAKHL